MEHRHVKRSDWLEAESCALRGKSVGVAMLLDVSLTLELWVEISTWEEQPHIPKQNGEFEQTDSLSFFLLAGKLSVVAKCLVARLTNQMEKLKPVSWDLWQRKPPLSSGYALGLGSVLLP